MQHTFLQQSSRVPGLGNIPGHMCTRMIIPSGCPQSAYISPLHCCSYTAMVRGHHQPADAGRDLQIWVPNLAEHNAICQCSVLCCHMHSAALSVLLFMLARGLGRPSKGLRHLGDSIDGFGKL